MDIIYFNQHVLNNLFYILVSIFFCYFISDHVRVFQKKLYYLRALKILCLSIPIILCMKFPIYTAPNCVHDLRQIPLLIGTLYGGWIVGLPLLIILLVARFIFYGFNYITVIVYVVMFIITLAFSFRFKKLNRVQKFMMSTLLTLFIGILTTVIAILISDFTVTDSYVIYFIFVPPIAMLFIVYIVETLNDAIIARTKLIKVEKMEVVSNLAASISHEIRNPLTVVKGFMQFLKEPNLSHNVREKYFDLALEELDRARFIIDDYLTFAKPAPEKVERIMVDRELEKVIGMVKPLANMNSVHISKYLVKGCIKGNSHHFHQCFLNLLKNSIEAMPNGGELCISTRICKNEIVIKIQDSGIGMTQEQMNRFGEPYFSTKEKGTGLGSMVALKIIQTMRGTLEIDSVVDKGTTLTITLPLCNK